MSLDARSSTDLLTDLWIGGKAVPASDGGRFDVLDPATGKVLADGRQRHRGGRDRRRRRRGRGRRGVGGDLAARALGDPPPRLRADDRAGRAPGPAGHAGERQGAAPTPRARSPTRPSSSAGTPRRRCAASAQVMTAPSGANKIMVLQQPVGIGVLVTPWNFPAAMATRKIGPALAAGLHRRPQAGQRHPADRAGDGPHPRRGRRAGGRGQRAAGAAVGRRRLGDAARPAGAQAVVHRQHRGRPGAAQGGRRPGHQLLDGARRQRPVPRLRRRRPRRRDRGRDDRQDAQRRRGVHRGQPVLRRALGRRRVRPPAGRADEGRCGWAPGSTTACRSARWSTPTPSTRSTSWSAARVAAGRRGGRRRPPSRTGSRASTTSRPCSSACARGSPILERGDLRAGRADRGLRRRGRGDPAGQRHRVRPGLLRLHRRPRPRPAGQRGARRPAWSASTAGWSATRPRRSAAPSRAASAARAATTGMLDYLESKYIAVQW